MKTIQRVLREGADDLTRAEEVDTQRACVNVDHIDEHFLGPPAGTPFAKQFLKELKEVSGKSCIITET